MSDKIEITNCTVSNDQVTQLRHERDLLGNLLVEIVIAAGIMDPDAQPTLPQLLLVGNDLLKLLKNKQE